MTTPSGIQRISLRQVRSQTVHLKDLDVQYTNREKIYHEDFYPVDGQTDIIIGTNYLMGSNVMQVLLNGVPVSGGSNGDYIEIDGKSIRFKMPLSQGDWVAVRIEGSGGGITLENTIHRNEIPIGDTDGVNTIFEIQYIPEKKSENVFINGILMSEGFNEDYKIEGKKITFYYAPPIDSKIRVSYRPVMSQFI